MLSRIQRHFSTTPSAGKSVFSALHSFVASLDPVLPEPLPTKEEQQVRDLAKSAFLRALETVGEAPKQATHDHFSSVFQKSIFGGAESAERVAKEKKAVHEDNVRRILTGDAVEETQRVLKEGTFSMKLLPTIMGHAKLREKVQLKEILQSMRQRGFLPEDTASDAVLVLNKIFQLQSGVSKYAVASIRRHALQWMSEGSAPGLAVLVRYACRKGGVSVGFDMFKDILSRTIGGNARVVLTAMLAECRASGDRDTAWDALSLWGEELDRFGLERRVSGISPLLNAQLARWFVESGRDCDVDRAWRLIKNAASHPSRTPAVSTVTVGTLVDIAKAYASHGNYEKAEEVYHGMKSSWALHVDRKILKELRYLLDRQELKSLLDGPPVGGLDNGLGSALAPPV
ncbi:hypothetical protein YB2330_006375 [Saitoella coloradoensis]